VNIIGSLRKYLRTYILKYIIGQMVGVTMVLSSGE